MPREQIAARVHPLIKRALDRRCKTLRRSLGWLIESMVIAAEGTNLPPGMQPGERIAGEPDDGEDNGPC